MVSYISNKATMEGIDLIFSIAVLIMSVVVHEVSHGYAASLLGDQTARYAGRLSLNPIKHLDPIGSVVVPLITSIGGFVFGWAKPVPVNPYNLRGKYGELIVSLAGPASNITLALIFGLLIRFSFTSGLLPVSFMTIAATIVLINIVLAVFNLVPIPPLDGSKVLFNLMPVHLRHIREFLERYAFIFILVFIFFVWQFLFPVVSWLFFLMTGLPIGM